MKEGKGPLSQRLRKEGRWEEASAFKDTVQSELIRSGMHRTDAAYQAWVEMERNYPPLPKVEEKKPEPASEPPAAELKETTEAVAKKVVLVDPAAYGENLEDKPPDLIADILWAYRYLDYKGVPPAPPGNSSVTMLNQARLYRNAFFDKHLPKALDASQAADDGMAARERMKVDEIRAVLARFEETKT